MTATGIIYEQADILIAGNVIAKIAAKIDVTPEMMVIPAAGKTITPGIIDTHSHLGVYAAPGVDANDDGNEIVAPVTAYARAADAYWPQDPQIDNARAGGITTMHILPGSANLIGGRGFTVRPYPGIRSSTDARFPGAPDSLKMACGENPKRVYGDRGGPSTRMGNAAGYRRAFQQALEYKRSVDRYQQELKDWEATQAESKSASTSDKGGKLPPSESPAASKPEAPSLDDGLETLRLVLEGEILVQNHCYRADEMSQMLELADHFGFQIRSFHHAVEGYKIADRLARAGTAASVWADWWGFKMEAFDGVQENAAMIAHAGARAVIHSDSPIGIQHLNQEAAKAMYAGRRAGIPISDDEALRWITANAAWVLGIHERTGTLEAGKLADIVIWSGSPFSVYSHAQLVMIEGSIVYDRNNPAPAPRTDFTVGLLHGELETPAQ